MVAIRSGLLALALSVGSQATDVTEKAVVHFATYPGYEGDLEVKGTLEVGTTADGVALVGTLAGLEASATGGIHIHSGFTCDDADSVGGHYFDGMDSDPWTTTYTSGTTGGSSIKFDMAGFSMSEGMLPVAGRAVVVHSSDGTRVACGLIEPTDGEFVFVALSLIHI